MNPLTEQLVEHDLDDTRHLIELTKGLTDDELRKSRLDGLTVLSWAGEEQTIAQVLDHQVFTKEVWLAAIEGADFPPREEKPDRASLLHRHDRAAPRWLATVRDIESRGAWDDRLIDALCDPPESFVLSGVIAHVLTFSAHRRQLARHMLRAAGVKTDHGDPINWLRARRGEIPGVDAE